MAHVSKIAKNKKCSTAQVALAWVLAQPGVVPIPGTTKTQNLLSNIGAEAITLAADDLAKLNALGQAKGYRYSEAAMKAYGFDDEMGRAKKAEFNESSLPKTWPRHSKL